MDEVYQFTKEGFEFLAGYTVKDAESLLSSIKIVSINGKTAEPNYVIQEKDKIIFEAKKSQKRNILIKD